MRYFNPRPPGGVRLYFLHHSSASHGFQSTHPGRGATSVFIFFAYIISQISIHAPRVGCDPIIKQSLQTIKISIHAPRVGCDMPMCEVVRRSWSISIHAPRVGCDSRWSCFRSTVRWISIHAPRVGCDLSSFALFKAVAISIHAPRVGCDCAHKACGSAVLAFQSTHPGWGATQKCIKDEMAFMFFCAYFFICV